MDPQAPDTVVGLTSKENEIPHYTGNSEGANDGFRKIQQFNRVRHRRVKKMYSGVVRPHPRHLLSARRGGNETYSNRMTGETTDALQPKIGF